MLNGLPTQRREAAVERQRLYYLALTQRAVLTGSNFELYNPLVSTRGYALVSLLIIGVCLFISAFLFWQGAWQLSEIVHPPPIAFIALGVAILTLLFADPPQWVRAAGVPIRVGPPNATPLKIQARLRLGLSALLISVLLILLPVWPDQADFTVLLLLWAITLLLYVLSVSGRSPFVYSPFNLKRNLIIVPVILLAFALRLWNVQTLPFTLGGDEANLGLGAVQVIEGDIRNPFATGWLGLPTLNFFFSSLAIRGLGQTVFALRFPWVMVGTLTVAVVFRLVSDQFGRRVGLMSAVMLATYHYHIHFSRLGSNQIADPYFASLALLCLSRAIRKGRLIDWASTGAVSGLALYSYAGARLAPLLVMIAIGYWLIFEPRKFWRQHRQGLVIALGGFCLVSLPLFEFALRFPDLFNERLNQVGLIQSGFLFRLLAEGRSLSEILLDQFLKSALAFNFYADRTFWYGLGEPLLNPEFGALFLLGLGYATIAVFRRRTDQRFFPFVVWWWGAVILGGMLTENPPSSQRLVTLTVPVCFLIALSLDRLYELGRRISTRLSATVLTAAVLIFGLTSIKTYFIEYSPRHVYGNPYAEAVTAIVPYVRPLALTHHVFLLGAPSLYWSFPSAQYLLSDVEGEDIVEPLEAPPSTKLVPPNKGAVFVVIPKRLSELIFIELAFPNGQKQEVRSADDSRLIATLYSVQP